MKFTICLLRRSAKTKHRVIATTDYTALECSTAHLNDCIRFEDDSDRGSGKIKTEHEGN